MEAVVRQGEAIETYADDVPYPSRLMLGFPGGEPIHTVIAHDSRVATCYIVTVYCPNPSLWTVDFRRRRSL